MTAERYVDARELEPWLDKRGLAQHLACSVRSIQTALAEGMPHAIIFGRVKFRVSEVEPWLEARGHLVRVERGDTLCDGKQSGPGGAPAPRGLDTRG